MQGHTIAYSLQARYNIGFSQKINHKITPNHSVSGTDQKARYRSAKEQFFHNNEDLKLTV